MLFTLRGKSVDGLSDKTTYIILQYGMIVNFLSMVEFKSKTSKTMWVLVVCGGTVCVESREGAWV